MSGDFFILLLGKKGEPSRDEHKMKLKREREQCLFSSFVLNVRQKVELTVSKKNTAGIDRIERTLFYARFVEFHDVVIEGFGEGRAMVSYHWLFPVTP